ncbi:kinase-like domain-containing protein [Syncephalastrum racemosum]|uniref:Kinase-like domain-containing protein n=1 Tax=Syncephalastrum racemosum TaxID=13706 RepID=A0A1X2H8M8_SYNRA|nr:kinase-like domain-containing protein [Syncephalastrum racemosum]
MSTTTTTTTSSFNKLANLHPGFLARYSLGQELGSGGFGFVMSAVERQTGVERAVKFIYKSKVPESAWIRDRKEGVMPIELYILKHVQHPGVVQYIDSFEDRVYFYLVMEMHGSEWNAQPQKPMPVELPPSPPASPHSEAAPSFDDMEEEPPKVVRRRTSCDLFECIEQHHHLDENLGRHVFRQIVDTVAYLDQLGVCHRDIKDENIVIDDNYTVKLIDFGSAIIKPRNHKRNPTYYEKFFGTVSFASPEILLRRPYRAEPAEVWALGVLLYTMLFGEVPFVNPAAAVMGRFTKPKVPVSSKCIHLISCMLERQPEKRPTIHQVLLHPWLQQQL